jgi:hypothetical protein
MNRLHKAVSALLVAGMVTLPYAPALAMGDQGRGRNRDRDRYEDRWDNRDRKDRRAERRAERRDRDYQRGYWDAARYYRQDDRRYRPRRLGRNDRIYRGSDDRYYCRRDDGTTGLIVGGMAGGVLGQIIAPGGSKTIGSILGAGAGALLGREIDRGDVVCR